HSLYADTRRRGTGRKCGGWHSSGTRNDRRGRWFIEGILAWGESQVALRGDLHEFAQSSKFRRSCYQYFRGKYLRQDCNRAERRELRKQNRATILAARILVEF